MRIDRAMPVFLVGVALLLVSGCTTAKDLEPYATKAELSNYATKADLEALRNDLMAEIRQAQDAARAAEANAAQAAAAAQQAANDAALASEKADAIFRKSLRK